MSFIKTEAAASEPTGEVIQHVPRFMIDTLVLMRNVTFNKTNSYVLAISTNFHLYELKNKDILKSCDLTTFLQGNYTQFNIIFELLIIIYILSSP